MHLTSPALRRGALRCAFFSVISTADSQRNVLVPVLRSAELIHPGALGGAGADDSWHSTGYGRVRPGVAFHVINLM